MEDETEVQDSNLDAETSEVVETSQEEAAELKKAQEYAQNQKIRAEKAEKELKALKGKKEEKVDDPILTKKDQILEARALNSLHEDDIDEVVAIAEAKKISLSEAVKSPYVQAFIKSRDEERKTAAATATKTTKQTASQTKETLASKAHNYMSGETLAGDEIKEAAGTVLEEVFGKK